MAMITERVEYVDPLMPVDDSEEQAEVEEWNAAVERGDPEHVAAVAELARRWEEKGWRIVPGERPGDPPRGVRVAGLGGETQ